MSEEKQAPEKKSGRARGGQARAAKMSPEARSAIARKASEERWRGDVPKAACGSPDRPLRIGGIELPCYVLEDGTRVLSQAGFLEALGRHRKASVKRDESEDPVPTILQGKAIKPFLTPDIIQKSRPIRFQTPDGSRASGYRAELLPVVCEIYLKAREEGLLAKSQEHIARAAEILIRGFAQVGIIALVDEATGYQDFRAKTALGAILEAFIAKELQRWVSTFPGDYYREMFRLRGLKFPTDTLNRPQYFGVLTNDIVYKRLAPGVLDELKKTTPRNDKGRLKHKYFQRLTDNVGYPKLREHLGSVVAIMKLSDNWHDFMRKVDRIHPRFGETMTLPLDYQPSEDSGSGL